MKKSEFLAAMQSRVARVAVGASTVRGRGHTGAVAAARDFFRELNLKEFVGTRTEFEQSLDRATRRLLRKLPKGARAWGISRKLLNIFLRDCLYSAHLASHFKLSQVEDAMEIPLDALTAKGLQKRVGRGKLPAWPGVKHVERSLSVKYQQAAADEAAKSRIARVHLDAVLWSVSRDGKAD